MLAQGEKGVTKAQSTQEKYGTLVKQTGPLRLAQAQQ